MNRGKLGLADKIALIALGGIVASLLVWLAYSFVDGVVFKGGDLTTTFVMPTPQEAWLRLVAIIVVLIGTLAIQIVSARRIQVEQELSVEKSRTRQIHENSPDSIVCLDPEYRVVYANPRADEMSGSPIAEDGSVACYDALYGLDERCPGCLLEGVLEEGEALGYTHCVLSAEGAERWIKKQLYPITDNSGGIVSIVEVARDITAVRQAEDELRRSHFELESRVEERTRELQAANAELRDEVRRRERIAAALTESEERYRRLIEDSPDMILVHRDHEITFVNSAGLSLLGVEATGSAVGENVMSLLEPNGSGLTTEELGRSLREGDAPYPLPLRLKRNDGSFVDVEVTASPLVINGEDYVQCVARDITERLRAEETIRRMAYYDELTGLPNRTLFQDRLAKSVARARRAGTTIAVAFLDLDDFKVINDTLGHSLGDALLRAVGARLTGILREGDTVARHSGDEFTIIAELTASDDVEALASRIIEGLTPAFNIMGHDLHVTCSLGMALFPEHGDDDAELLKKADTAMYHAKDSGQSRFEVFEPEMAKAAHARLELENELRAGIEGQQFELYYQPQVDLDTSSIVGVEALLRWNHPARGLVLPGGFLGVAEQAGLIGHIGRWVLAQACAQAREWLDSGVEVGRVAVNLTSQEFLHQDLIETVASALERTGVPPQMLELEITESVAIQNMDQVLATLGGLRELGVRIAIDDFGTGYSSMSYLQRFPIQTLKIAQTFMRSVHEDPQSAAIALMMISLCRELDLDIVAEGVENGEQLEFLQGRGTMFIQGNLFCEARCVAEITKVLTHGIGVKV